MNHEHGPHLVPCPLYLADANELVEQWHRHHQKVVGHLFSIGAMEVPTNKVVGAIIVGRPVSRMLDNGWTMEVTRCVTDGTRNACSMLYAAAWRAAKAMGCTRLITYVLASESGGSLKASGWKEIGRRGGGSWSVPSRPRVDKHPTCEKMLWEIRP